MLDVAPMVLAVVVVAIFVVVISRRWRTWSVIEKIPGEIALPFLGNTYELLFTSREDFMDYMERLTNKFWPIHRFWIGSIPDIRICKPEHIEKIMGNSELITKSEGYDFLHPWLGKGLLTSTGTKWHSHRKMITPAFHFSILENFVEVFAEKADVLVNILKSKADGLPFDVYPYLSRCTLDIICETAMGTSVNAQKNAESAYVTAIYRISELIIRRLLCPWLQLDFFFQISPTGKEFYKQLDILHGFTKQVIEEKKLSRRENISAQKATVYDDLGRKRRVAFLDMLLTESEDGHALSDQEIQEEVDTFMFEGHDTTSAAISWTLTLLGHHPNIQERVYAEMKEIFHNDKKRTPTMQDLHNMKYLEMVIKESLRLYPSVPIISRKATKEIEVGGYKIPKGASLTMQIYHTHRDPDHWPQPTHFDPNNFLPERVQKRHPYAYVPFSAGLRNCIGQKFAILEEKTVLSYVLRSYRVETVEKLEEMKLTGELVLRSFNGFRLKLTPR